MVALIPGLGRFPGGEHGNPLQYSCLENSMDRGAWQAAVHVVTESDRTETTYHTHKHTLGTECNILLSSKFITSVCVDLGSTVRLIKIIRFVNIVNRGLIYSLPSSLVKSFLNFYISFNLWLSYLQYSQRLLEMMERQYKHKF